LLFQKYSPKVIYCCSDEVTIVYSSFKEERFVPLSGRIQKISSMVKHSSLLFSQFSSHFTSNFNKVLRDKIEEFKEYPNYKRIQEKVENGATFDARFSLSCFDHLQSIQRKR
jgi:hypothetical protein